MLAWTDADEARDRHSALDETDRQLIQLLQAAPRGDKRTLAIELGVSAPTLSSRLGKLSEMQAGALRLQRDFKAMGYAHLASLDIEASGAELSQIASAIAEINQVLAVVSFLERPSLSVQVVVHNPAQLQTLINNELSAIPAIGRIRSSISLQIHRYSNLFSEHGIGPSESLPPINAQSASQSFEEDVLEVLQRDATLSNRQIAKQLDTTEHRVRRNLNRLLDEGAIAFNYLVSPLAMGMQVWAYLRIAVEPCARDDVLKLLLGTQNCVSICEVAGEWNFLAWFVAEDIAELSEFSDLIAQHSISISARTVRQVHKHNCDYARILD